MESDCAPRLDTSHGFIKSIIKNQINRDEYHKFMEEKRQQTEKTLTEAAQQANNETAGPSGTQKKRRSQPQPATQLYIPPHLRRQGNMDRPSTSKMSNSPKRTNFSTNIVDNVEEEKLREKARARFKERFTEQPSMNFTPSTSQIAQPSPSKPLFLLALRSETSETVEVAVMSNDNPARLAKELARKYGYTDEQCGKLRETLDYELDKRLNGEKMDDEN